MGPSFPQFKRAELTGVPSEEEANPSQSGAGDGGGWCLISMSVRGLPSHSMHQLSRVEEAEEGPTAGEMPALPELVAVKLSESFPRTSFALGKRRLSRVGIARGGLAAIQRAWEGQT